MSLRDIAEALRSGERDLIEHVESVCNLLDTREPDIQAFLVEPNRRERLRSDAQRLLELYPDPASRPALFGVPVGVKDIFHVNGFVTRAGSELPPELFAGPEASVVSKLKQHGALILGKTVATEFAFADPGPTRNPHNPGHTPGGSSSGSAAAVAAGYCPLALGTQTIGSIARPASYCGIVGFKPSYGRIPVDGCVPFSPAVDHVGFFVKAIHDVAPIARFLCDAWRSEILEEPPPVAWTVGVPVGPYLEQATPEMRTMFDRAVESLALAGHEIRFINLYPEWADIVEAHYDLIAAEMADYHRAWFDQYRTLYREGSRALIERGRRVSAQVRANARSMQDALRSRVLQHMSREGIDCWFTPSATEPAQEGLTSTGNPRMNLPWTYTGLPTVTVPAGVSNRGLPMGVQWVGRFGEDERLLQSLLKRYGALAVQP